jgi:hypothetical protein
MTTPIDRYRPDPARGARWLRRLRRILATQQQLWDRYLASSATTGEEARAAMGEPPLRSAPAVGQEAEPVAGGGHLGRVDVGQHDRLDAGRRRQQLPHG